MSIRRLSHKSSVLTSIFVAVFAIALVGCELEEPVDPAVPEEPTEPEEEEVAQEDEQLEANKEVVQQAIQAVSDGNLDELDRYIAEDVVDHGAMPGQPQGLEGVRQTYAQVHQSFEDLTIEVEEMVAEGNLVAARGTSTWENHQEEIMGIPPTGNDATVPGFSFFRVEDGMIVERWGTDDTLSLVQQLGAELEVPERELTQRELIQ